MKLLLLKEENVDYTEIENRFGIVRSRYNKIYDAATKDHNTAVGMIDGMISDLTKMRTLFTSSDTKLLSAGKVLEDLTLKQLAKGKPAVLAQIGEFVSEQKKPSTRKKTS